MTLKNQTRRRVLVHARDVVPWQLGADEAEGQGDCPAAGTWELAYRVFPVHRGQYEVGPLAIRLRGPLGLAWQPYTIPLVEPVKVYLTCLQSGRTMRCYTAPTAGVGFPEHAPVGSGD